MNAILSLMALNALASPPMPPALVAESATIDRGELKAGAPLTQTFKFTNRSLNQTVEIAGVKVSCGCAKSSFDKEKLKPGETATLTVQVNTLAQAAGPWSWTATVRYKYAGDAAEETLPVRMTGTLVREVTLTPPGLAISLESGSVTQNITLTDTRTTPLAVKGAAPTSSFLKATLQAGDKPGQTRIAVTIAENAPLGEHNETIVLATDDPLYPELRVPVKVSKKSPAKVKAEPDELVLTSRDNVLGSRFGLSPPPEVSLRRRDGQPLKIAQCEIDNGNISLKWPENAAVSMRVKLTIPERIWNERGKATLKITLAEPAGEVVIVPVEWNPH
jgi:hypothetical protein